MSIWSSIKKVVKKTILPAAKSALEEELRGLERELVPMANGYAKKQVAKRIAAIRAQLGI